MSTLELLRHGEPVGTIAVVDGEVVASGVGREVAAIRVQERAGGKAVRDLSPADGDLWLRTLGERLSPNVLTARLIDSDIAKFDEDQPRDESGRWTSWP